MKMLPLECLADAGRQLGRIDKALDRLYPVVRYPTATKQDSSADSFDGSLLEAARRFHQWDGKNTAELSKFTHCIVDAKRRLLVESVIDTFCSTLLESGVSKQFRKGVNHGDYNDANVLLDDDFHVTGVIDFGDSVERYVPKQWTADTLIQTRVSGFCRVFESTDDKIVVGGSSLVPVPETPIRRARKNHGIKAPDCRRYHDPFDEWRCFMTMAVTHFMLTYCLLVSLFKAGESWTCRSPWPTPC
jgi:hypothetical protein